MSEPAPPSPWRGLWPALPVLTFGLVVWALLFRTEIGRAVAVWNASTAYSHCWFVLPISLYLAWDRGPAIAGMAPRPILWPVLLALPGALVWLVAERVGLMEGRQLVGIGFIELLFLAVLGGRLAWQLSAPLLYLFFLVPFGAFLTDSLQHFTARFIDIGLWISGVPYLMDDFSIEIPEGRFYVAEACAGLRFLIASIAFGVLYSCLIYRSPWRRVAFMLASCVIPVIANGFRALGIVLAGHILGNAQAVAADHVIYGWVFFSIVILLLILAGLPFRQDMTPPPAPFAADPMPPAAPMPLWRAGVLMALVMAAGPGLTAALDRGGAAVPMVALPGFVPGPGCGAAEVQTSTWSAQGRGPLAASQRFICDGLSLTATVAVFPLRANPAQPIAARRDVSGQDRAEDTATSPLGVPGWQLMETQQPDHVTASALWIDADPTLGGLAGRLRQARNSLFGGTAAPVLAAVSLDGDGPLTPLQRQQARTTIQAFVAAQAGLDARLAELARAAATSR